MKSLKQNTARRVPAPSIADILNGEYNAVIGDMRFSGWEDHVNVVFTPDAEGALTDTMVVTFAGINY